MAIIEVQATAVHTETGNEVSLTLIEPSAFSRDDVNENIYLELCSVLAETSSLSEVKENWSISTRKWSFADSPWKNTEDILNAIRSIDGVRGARIQSAMDGAYGPPKIHVNSRLPEEELREKVHEYYDGLKVEGSTVIISALESFSSNSPEDDLNILYD